MIMKSLRSVKDNLSTYTTAENPLQTATYRDVTVSVDRIEAASLVLARKDLVEINLVSCSS